MGRWEDRDHVSQLEAHCEEFICKLDSQIELHSHQHNQGEEMRLHGGGGPNREHEREPEVDNHGSGTNFPVDSLVMWVMTLKFWP